MCSPNSRNCCCICTVPDPPEPGQEEHAEAAAAADLKSLPGPSRYDNAWPCSLTCPAGHRLEDDGFTSPGVDAKTHAFRQSREVRKLKSLPAAQLCCASCCDIRRQRGHMGKLGETILVIYSALVSTALLVVIPMALSGQLYAEMG